MKNTSQRATRSNLYGLCVLLLLLLGHFVGTTNAISLLGNNKGWSSSSSSPSLPKVGLVTAGPLQISQIGCGTWSWGNRLLWDYDTAQDEEIYEAYATVRRAGVTVFDTVRMYGIHRFVVVTTITRQNLSLTHTHNSRLIAMERWI